MKHHSPITLRLLPLCLVVSAATAFAQAPAPDADADVDVDVEALEEARALEERIVAETYLRALMAAEAEQKAALEAVSSAREDLERRALEEQALAEQLHRRAEAKRESSESRRREAAAMAEAERAELAEVRRELARAHENLRRASREVARVHRDIDRSVRPAPEVRLVGGRAVIGVVLGDNTDRGVRVLGLSPDGPAERAGIRQGDVIVGLMGESLTEGGVDGREVLTDAMRAVDPGDELTVRIDRGGEEMDVTVVADERTPFTFQSVTRLATVPTAPTDPDAPDAPDAPRPPVVVQEIEVPRIDRERLEKELERVREDLEARRIVQEWVTPEGGVFIYEADALSEIAEDALAGADLWSGMSLTRGLKLSNLEDGLGAYFDTDRGVLVLRARADNALQLETGDVILSVGGESVNRPGDVVRALRDADAGDTIDIEIKRQRRDETLSVVIPEARLGLRFPKGALRFSGNELRFSGNEWRFPLAPAADD